MKITTKIIVLMMVVMTMLVTAVMVNVVMDSQRIAQLFEVEKTEKSRNFDEIVRLSGASLKMYVFDYTYWDEMARFIDTHDLVWAKEYIDTSINTYKANAVWVYDAEFKAVYYSDTLVHPDRLRELPIPRGSVKELFAGNNRFCHFFVDSPEGVMEIRGASVHLMSDEKRKMDPKGYFFAGRMINKAYLEELSEYLGGMTIKMSDSLDGASNSLEDPKKGMIRFTRAIKSWNGEIVGYFQVSARSSALEGFSRASGRVLLVTGIFMITVMILLILFLTRWINLPLTAIFHALEKEDSGEIARFLGRWDEFGRIAQLIDNFFRQRKTIIAEMERRKKIEDELSAKISQLKQFKDVAVGREIKMIELKKEVNKLSKELGSPEPYDASF